MPKCGCVRMHVYLREWIIVCCTPHMHRLFISCTSPVWCFLLQKRLWIKFILSYLVLSSSTEMQKRSHAMTSSRHSPMQQDTPTQFKFKWSSYWACTQGVNTNRENTHTSSRPRTILKYKVVSRVAWVCSLLKGVSSILAEWMYDITHLICCRVAHLCPGSW